MRRILVIASLALLTQLGMAQTKIKPTAKPMSDAAMDRVTAAGVSAGVSDGVVKFQGQVPTANGLVSSAGTMSFQSGLTGTTMGTLSLSDNAQQNLHSLVNINAVNSKINVLMNLNVNINSTVGTMTQANMNGSH
ncbi:hypothetical protein EDE15_3504 [Edaphobacter aggregans]|jgi:hypothetical protein|uniref:Uncharacterized protein n=1 Tax=Edaphobacter aggregans TaxID=570835 RepID=A0A3R9NVS8_9BACT|nr:hypothetical protein [Edaphobacter aggregans]RSL17952.1 hypothetical protein EDE15_3504 [Edaphobacter aggregans]